MAVPIRHRDMLLNYFRDGSKPAWARDLIAKVIKQDGNLTEVDREIIIDETLNGTAVPSENLTGFVDNAYQKIEIKKLTHVSGMFALAANQTIDFCYEGHTFIYGGNGSGKSSFFRILNQLAQGGQTYPIESNIYAPVTPMSVIFNYMVDGVDHNNATWDGVTAPPTELKHIRLFDSNYASTYLRPRGGNEYVFTSMGISRYRGLANALRYLDELGAPLGPEKLILDGMCDASYSQIIITALQISFQEELRKLGMDYLRVNLRIVDLLGSGSEVKVHITNVRDVEYVLSEAERKCVALALFFAEHELLEVKQPLIFDDPVNSLDTTIIQHFAKRITEIDSQVILFTHSAILLSLLKEYDGHSYKIHSSPVGPRTGNRGTHVLIYDIIATAPHQPGYVVNHKDYKSAHYLNVAQEMLNNDPWMPDTRQLVDILRIVVEWIVDEVVFQNQQPLRYRGFTSIPWTKLASRASFGGNNVLDLQQIYGQLSNAGSHVGFGAVYTPLSRAQLVTIKNQIETIRHIVYP